MLSHEIDHVGMLAFLQLFQAHPDAQNSFKLFRNLNYQDLEQSDILKSHASRVTSVIKKVAQKLPHKSIKIEFLIKCLLTLGS